MMMNNEIQKETGNRKSDASQRFNSHPSNNTFHAVFEPIDNLLTYIDKFGKITYEEDFETANFRFVNDGTSENLPTYERLREIFMNAGATMSSKIGSSICGMGIEVFGLESRPSSASTVMCKIDIVRDNLSYGGILWFIGSEREISYELSSPRKYEGKNQFSIEFRGCWPLNSDEKRIWKSKISEKLNALGKNVEVKYGNEILPKVDMLYEKELRGTKNFTERTFSYSYDGGRNTELMTIKIADVNSIAKGEKANIVDKSFGQLNPAFSGFMVVYNGQTTVHRGDNSWKIIGKKRGHPTINGIRANILIDKYVFEQLHSQSQVKCETNGSIKGLKDIYLAPIKFTDVNTGEELTGADICSWVKSFYNAHKTDLDNTEKKNECAEILKAKTDEELNTLADFLSNYVDNKVKPKTLYSIIIKEIENRYA